MTCCPPLLFQGHPFESNKLTAQSGCCSAGCSARLAAASLSLPLLFSSFPFLSTAWALDVVASWNASFSFAPSFLHRFRLSSERFASSTTHTFGAKPREGPLIDVRQLLATSYVALLEPSHVAFQCPWRSAFECLVDMPLRACVMLLQT